MLMESIVRPFEAPRAIAPRRLIPVPADDTPPENVTVMWGRADSDDAVAFEVIDPIAARAGFTTKKYVQFIEQLHEADRRRFEQANKPENYVDVDNITKAKFRVTETTDKPTPRAPNIQTVTQKPGQRVFSPAGGSGVDIGEAPFPQDNREVNLPTASAAEIIYLPPTQGIPLP